MFLVSKYYYIRITQRKTSNKMKKLIITGALITAPFLLKAQWRTEVVSNDFSDDYHIAYNTDKNSNALLMEDYDGDMFLSLELIEPCNSTNNKVEVVLINGSNVKTIYQFETFTTEDGKIVIDYLSHVNSSQFISDFKKSTILKVRFICDSDYMVFNQSRSDFAYKFVKG